MASFLRLSSAMFLATACLLAPEIIPAALPSKALPPYVDGLDALNDGRWADAASAFSRALEVSGDDPEIVLARGVAYTLAEDFPRAFKDLDRAKRLGMRGREPELWTYVAEAMSGIIADKSHALGGFAGRSDVPAVVSIPGHMAQGRDDYSTEYASFIVYRLGMEYQKYRLPDRFRGRNDPAGVKGLQMRQAMLKAGQLFAERNYRRPELASLTVSRAKQSGGGKAAGGSMAHVERALAADPGNPNAHYQAGKAWLDAGHAASARKEFTIALTFKTDFADAYAGRAAAAARLGNQADKLADQALELAGDDPDALRLYAKFRAMRANQMSTEAWSLRQERCSSSSHDETRSDGVYRVMTTTCYPPSQADLQRAAQLDATAAELRRRAKSALLKAAKVTRGTVDGFLILADLALWEGKAREAQAVLEQAVKLDPKSLEAQDRLVQFYAQSGQQERAEEQRLIAANLVQTTAAPLLRSA